MVGLRRRYRHQVGALELQFCNGAPTPAYRCLVPFTSFAEPVRDSTWFSIVNVWRPWHGERLAEQPGQMRRGRALRDWQLYSFLRTEANEVVRPIHEKAMPVILIDPVEQAEWLQGGEETLRLQRPLPNEQLEIRP